VDLPSAQFKVDVNSAPAKIFGQLGSTTYVLMNGSRLAKTDVTYAYQVHYYWALAAI